jgi:hypothetical protein
VNDRENKWGTIETVWTKNYRTRIFVKTNEMWFLIWQFCVPVEFLWHFVFGKNIFVELFFIFGQSKAEFMYEMRWEILSKAQKLYCLCKIILLQLPDETILLYDWWNAHRRWNHRHKSRYMNSLANISEYYWQANETNTFKRGINQALYSFRQR